MKRSFAYKPVILVLAGILVQSYLFAAPPPPPMGGPPCWPPPCMPIDGGIVFLLIAGALFGGWKIYRFRYGKKAV